LSGGLKSGLLKKKGGGARKCNSTPFGKQKPDEGGRMLLLCFYKEKKRPLVGQSWKKFHILLVSEKAGGK